MSGIFTTFVERNVKVITSIGNRQSFTAGLKANRMFSSFVASKTQQNIISVCFCSWNSTQECSEWFQWSHLLRNSKSKYIYESMMTDHWKPSEGKSKKFLTLEQISLWYFTLREKKNEKKIDMILWSRNFIINKLYHFHILQFTFAEDIKASDKVWRIFNSPVSGKHTLRPSPASASDGVQEETCIHIRIIYQVTKCT